MSTFGALIDATIQQMSGFTSAKDQSTYLTADVTSGATSFTVADASGASRGVVEIGDELVAIDTTDTTAQTLTAPPYGRGYMSTTAAAHTANTRVNLDPLFPRGDVKRALNDTITSLYPLLFGIGTTTFVWSPSQTAYSMPALAQMILSIEAQEPGFTQEWSPVRRWRLENTANLTAFPTGKTVSIYENLMPGCTVNITYASKPVALSASADDFAGVTGLPASCEDLVRFGAAARLATFIDVGNLSGSTAEAAYASNARPQAGGISLSRHLLNLYQVRLQEEARAIQDLYPSRSHFTY